MQNWVSTKSAQWDATSTFCVGGSSLGDGIGLSLKLLKCMIELI